MRARMSRIILVRKVGCSGWREASEWNLRCGPAGARAAHEKRLPTPFLRLDPCAFVNKPSTGDKADMPAVSKGVTPNRTAPGARANVAPTPTTPEESGGSDQEYIRQGPASVSGEPGAQETRANKRTPRIVGVRKGLDISIRPILPFHRSTRL
jgi:hypothetical protein